MSFVNIAQQKQIVSFGHAVLNPIGENRGIYFPQNIERLPEKVFATKDFQTIAVETLYSLTSGELPRELLQSMISKAFNFPIRVQSLNSRLHVLELFHGPTLAFKDFGARFLAECLAHFNKEKATIVTATSGDTGAAVAHAFHGQPDIDVVILYPKGKISKEQEQLFCTLGDNIHTVQVNGDFDACQILVKQAFSDDEVTNTLNLNSANSINVARLVAQVCYYNALPALLDEPIDRLFVPSGNFGNLTAAMIARAMGAPINHLVAATNKNDTVPRFFLDKTWYPKETQRTLSNAMDVSKPNNFSRILYHYQNELDKLFDEMSAISVDDQRTCSMIKYFAKQNYMVDPHTAVGLRATQCVELFSDQSNDMVAATAHPAKFADVLEDILKQPIDRPEAISRALDKPNLSDSLDNDFDDFKDYLLALHSSH